VAQRVTVQQVDDTDGSEAEETVRFGLDGTAYEIDLSAAHAEQLRDALARYVAAARREGRLARGVVHRSVETDVDPAAVRAWARGQGIEVSQRGRLPADVVARFREAGN
jgi:hypothetical protein